MRIITLKPGRAKPLWMGHPWVFADSIAKIEPPMEAAATEPGGDWVRVVDADGKVLGQGLHSPRSTIRVRLVTRGKDDTPPEDVLRARLERAVALRARLFPDAAETNAYRLVHGEGDGLPGLVADRLGDVIVAQFGTAPTHTRRESLARHLLEFTGARTLVARKAGFEDVEGIPPDEQPFVVGEALPERVEIRESGLVFEAAPLAGQKTGHYADQRENRRLVGAMAKGLDVLDLYAGTGGFALQCAHHGARRVLAVDSSPHAVEAAISNAARNGLSDRIEAQRGDVKERLAALRAEKKRFDLVVVDPPNFFPRKGVERHAMKAYRELNVRSLSRVQPDGFLATFSCSARMDPVRFLELLRSASRECRREFRVLRELAAGPDHPVAQGLPEGRYLTGLLLQVEA